MVDTATQTDPITIIDSAVQSSLTNTNSQTEELQRQKVQTNNATRSQTKTPIGERGAEVGLRGGAIEMIKKDLKKQRQKERQARSHSSPSRKDQTKIKSSQGTKKLVP